MPTENPFDVILLKLDHLQSTVNDLTTKVATKNDTKEIIDPNRLVDLPEAAKLVKKPVGTVRHYIHHRNLPAKRIGKSFIIKYSDLMAWIDTFNEDGQETAIDATKGMLQNRKRYNKQSPSFSSGSANGK
jgi:excisionase family DNA binding protein